ncbi:mCG56655, isoform CRA_a [Mus musculus]|nr:mCG56655, isoform CRA_a [Mus musculus]
MDSQSQTGAVGSGLIRLWRWGSEQQRLLMQQGPGTSRTAVSRSEFPRAQGPACPTVWEASVNHGSTWNVRSHRPRLHPATGWTSLHTSGPGWYWCFG